MRSPFFVAWPSHRGRRAAANVQGLPQATGKPRRRREPNRPRRRAESHGAEPRARIWPRPRDLCRRERPLCGASTPMTASWIERQRKGAVGPFAGASPRGTDWPRLCENSRSAKTDRTLFDRTLAGARTPFRASASLVHMADECWSLTELSTSFHTASARGGRSRVKGHESLAGRRNHFLSAGLFGRSPE